MRLVHALVLVAAPAAVRGFRSTAPPRPAATRLAEAAVAEAAEADAVVAVTPIEMVTYADVQRLGFRALQRECKALGLAEGGATPAEIEELCATEGITFCDDSDPDFDFKAVLAEVMQKSSVGHWKAATRKLKALRNKHATPERPVPREAHLAVLEACAAFRLNGARAAEPARKILEDMATCGHEIPANLANTCVTSALGPGPRGTHEGCGGIDVALAMAAAVEAAPGGATALTEENYGRVAEAAARSDDRASDVLQVLTYAKAAGYELDGIA